MGVITITPIIIIFTIIAIITIIIIIIVLVTITIVITIVPLQANFARNHAHHVLLPLNVTRILYLDTDTIILRDIQQLWKIASLSLSQSLLQSSRSLSISGDSKDEQHDNNDNGDNNSDLPVMFAIRSCDRPMNYFYNFNHHIISNTFHNNNYNDSDSDSEICYINAGVYVMDLVRYKQRRVDKRIEELIRIHGGVMTHSDSDSDSDTGGLWHEGTHQPSFILALYNHTTTTTSTTSSSLSLSLWNVSGLGWNMTKTQGEITQSFIVHWSGAR